MKLFVKAVFFASLTGLAGCGGADIDYTYPQDNVYGKPITAKEAARENENTLFNAVGLFGDSDKDKNQQPAGLAVNSYLWNASLDTLSFLPLQSTDPFGGVIVTDWGTMSSKPNERVKVTVRIDSPDLRASAVRVNVFREVRNPTTSTWETASVAPETSRQIEDSILRRARQLRIAELDR